VPTIKEGFDAAFVPTNNKAAKNNALVVVVNLNIINS
jgi:hypothetical protein